MKVVVLTGLARTLILFRARLLEDMGNAGHQVIACAPEDDAQIARRLSSLGVAYHAIPLARAGLNPYSDVRFFLRLLRFLRRERPDVVFSYTIKSVVYGSIAARFAGVAGIYSMISGIGYAFADADIGRRWMPLAARALYRASLANNRAVFFQNPDDEALFLRLGAVRDPTRAVLVNGSGVDLLHFAETPLPAGPPRFLLIARMLKDKGIVEFVEAARVLKRRFPHVVIRLIGPVDVNPASLRPEQIESWGREGVVEYRDWVDDVRPAIADSSVFVLPSYREGTPHTVLEAIAMGRPIITSNAPGCRETVREGENGFLVPARDVTALVKAMERFVREPELIPQMGRRSRQIAEEKFDVRKVNQVLLETMGLIPATPTTPLPSE